LVSLVNNVRLEEFRDIEGHREYEDWDQILGQTLSHCSYIIQVLLEKKEKRFVEDERCKKQSNA